MRRELAFIAERARLERSIPWNREKGKKREEKTKKEGKKERKVTLSEQRGEEDVGREGREGGSRVSPSVVYCANMPLFITTIRQIVSIECTALGRRLMQSPAGSSVVEHGRASILCLAVTLSC